MVSSKRNGSNDPFNTLPDHLLRSITSSLDHKDAARTVAISKRWTAIWPCSRKVVLDEKAFTDDEKRHMLMLDGRHSLAEGIKRTGRCAFIDFVRRFTARYQEERVDSFCICFPHPEEFIADVKECVRIATKRAVKELELDFTDRDLHRMFPEGYTGYAELMPEVYELHESLHTLKLSGCYFEATRFGALCKLRVLSISRIDVKQKSIDLILGHCRHLEDLSLIRLVSLDAINIVDRNRVLKRLTIEECVPVTYGLVVEAPTLKFFKYSGLVKPFSLDVWNLEEAELDFGLETVFGGEGDLLSDILLRLGNVRQLTVCSYITQVVASGEEQFHLPATVDKLRHLTLKTALHRDELPGVALLLRSYPQLESLTIEVRNQRPLEDFEYPYTPILDGKAFWETQILRFVCIQSHLKTVRVEGFRGRENEIRFLQFLLGRSRVLQEVIINVLKERSSNCEQDVVNSQVLHGLNRASPSVQMLISSV